MKIAQKCLKLHLVNLKLHCMDLFRLTTIMTHQNFVLSLQPHVSLLGYDQKKYMCTSRWTSK